VIMQSEPKETAIDEINRLLYLMSPEDREKSLKDLHLNKQVFVTKTYDADGKLIGVKYTETHYFES